MRSLANSINSINKHVSRNAAKVNPCDLAVQRLLQFRLFSDKLLKGVISGVYPSTISSDVAFVTADAVINIDTKTTRLETNKGDWNTQIVGKNQSSFKHLHHTPPSSLNVSSPVNFLLDTKFHNKPVLSFVLSFFYSYDQIKKRFSWCNTSKTNIKFACIPNGDLSKLYQDEIIYGVKQYINPSKKQLGTSSVRISHDILKDRFDKNGKVWTGFKEWQI